jgi:hypothetical protein
MPLYCVYIQYRGQDKQASTADQGGVWFTIYKPFAEVVFMSSVRKLFTSLAFTCAP